ncbi:hypothetical protein [uncultured Aeromicrobium sp.]|uniref:hypothetical protein n=1 Tax=uncultured Aeromicrobium sp. TaxID=337820 RepID=UPI0025F14DD3|nr:hypothetical protein [uncultured Aeromicrobium sp.]
MNRARAGRRLVIAVTLTALSAMTACSDDTDEESRQEPPRQSEATDAADRVVSLDGLSAVPSELDVGQSIDVIVDTPGTEWTPSSSDEHVVVVQEQSQSPQVIRVEAVGAGTAVVSVEAGSGTRVDHEFTVRSED